MLLLRRADPKCPKRPRLGATKVTYGSRTEELDAWGRGQDPANELLVRLRGKGFGEVQTGRVDKGWNYKDADCLWRFRREYLDSKIFQFRMKLPAKYCLTENDKILQDFSDQEKTPGSE